jgi:hypothetical protein
MSEQTTNLTNLNLSGDLEVEGTITGDIHATAGSIGATELASNAVETAKIKNANVTLEKLASVISPSHVIKFVKLGSEITTTALAGLVVGDLVLQFVAADGTVVAAPCAVADTLPNDPADADYIVVLRATA